MSDFIQRIANYSPKRLALLANELKERADALEAAAHEPIAIIGMGCRFPGGADTPELYWDLVRAGVDAITETDRSRWENSALYDADPDAPGKLSSRFGGFISNVDRFDPDVFGIARREAVHMDPQQRLLLEVAWEALENAGVAPDSLSGASVGVFAGLSGFDYYSLMRSDRTGLDAYSASGAAHSVASGRLAYVLGTRGPAISVDTACSSSLVAIHLAVQSLRRSECDMALAAGVNALLAPDTTIALSKARMMAPDGRCKAFDARADGFVRGEGCGVLVLKRLRDAVAARDPIVAVIRGSASNQDGRSNGLTAPSGVAQELVLRAALEDARADASQLGYIEAHGTGTQLGDPIEALSLNTAFAAARDHSSPLFVGSVKANIGHLESAAGVAGTIKLALALRDGIIPRQANFETPNPHIPWDDMRLVVPREERAWDGTSSGPRLGGVSSFGFSGTNVHLILEQAPELDPLRPDPRQRHIVTASARNEAALQETLEAYAASLSAPSAVLGEVAHAANAGRAKLGHRAAVIAETPAAAADLFNDLSRGEAHSGAKLGTAWPHKPKIAFLFTGQGAQYVDMGVELYRAQPSFAATFDQCDAILREHWDGLSLKEVIQGDPARLEDTTYAQPALFAVEYALAQLWISWGVKPAALTGHSLGEIVAACVAGMMSLEEGLALAAARGRLMGALPGGGAMAALMTDEARAVEAVAPFAETVSIAAFNGPLNTAISGAAADVEKICEQLRADGVTAKELKVSHAFHSHLIEPMLDAFGEAAARVNWRAPEIEVISNVTGESMGSAAPKPQYWQEHARAPVRFAQSMDTLVQSGCNAFIEIGPHPTLAAMGQSCAPDADALWLASLRRGASDEATILDSVASLYTAGTDMDWEAFDQPFEVRPARLPNYPFQRERFWIDAGPTGEADTSHLLYEVKWEEAQAPQPDELAAKLQVSIDAASAEGLLDSYSAFTLELDRLCRLYIVAVLRQLGWTLSLGSIATRDMADRLGVLPRHSRLFARMLAILGEDGILERSGDAWRVTSVPSEEDPDALADQLLEEYPDCSAEILLTRRCAGSLAKVLRGDADPLDLLFPKGSTEDTEALYQHSPAARFYNSLFGELAVTIAAKAAGRPLRILEVGAGTGSTTASVLERLGDAPYEYVFTDVSPLFLQRARDKFADYPALRYEVLDLERDLAEQGFELGAYDLVIGANVVHATRDLSQTCSRLRSLLTGDGRLALLEAVAPQRFGDLTVGMLEGWWAFVDTQRRSYALMPREDWSAVMKSSGFSQSVAVPPAGHGLAFDKNALLIAAPESTAPRRWFIAPDARGFADEAAAAMRAHGRTVRLLDPETESAVAQLGEAKGPIGVLYLGALDCSGEGAFEPSEQQKMLEPALEITRLLGARSGAAKLCIVTRGGQAARPNEAVEPAQATIWGLSHVVAIEHPDLDCTRVDIDPAASSAESAETLAAELFANGREDQIAFREDERLVRRLSRRTSRPGEKMQIENSCAYLVTGGMRGLGLLVAEWLVAQGARTLALMGRSDPGDAARAAIARMEEAGARILVCKGDVAKRNDVTEAFAAIEETGLDLGGVFHCAGVLDDGVLAGQSWERFATVMAPKVQGAWLLHEACGDAPLILFSSGASIAGSAGQANHAAANAFEDALAWMRQAQGQPALSINWGPWADIGAAADREISSTFLRPIAPDTGLAALEACLVWDEKGYFLPAQCAVLDSDWPSMVEQVGRLRTPPLFCEMIEQTVRSQRGQGIRSGARVETSWRTKVIAAGENRRIPQLRDEIRALVGAVLGAAPSNVGMDEPLRDLGLDSLMAVELRNRLSVAVEMKLPATVTFDYPSVVALTDYLLQQGVFGLSDAESEAPAPTPDKTDQYQHRTEAEVAAALAARLDSLGSN